MRKCNLCAICYHNNREDICQQLNKDVSEEVRTECWYFNHYITMIKDFDLYNNFDRVDVLNNLLDSY